MKIFFTILFSFVLFFSSSAQNLNGQWKGGFIDNSTSFMGFSGEKIDYVLELGCDEAFEKVVPSDS